MQNQYNNVGQLPDNYNGGGPAYGAYAVPPYGRPQAYGQPPAAPKYRLPPSSHGSQRSHVRAASNALGVAPAQQQPNAGQAGKYSVNNLKLPSLGPQAHRVGDAPRGGDYRGNAGADYRHLPPLMERA